MSIPSSFNHPTTNQCRDTERVTVLKHKIDALENHINELIENEIKPLSYDIYYKTSRLLFVLLLEKELYKELCLPLEHKQKKAEEFEQPHRSINNRVIIEELNKQILELDIQSDEVHRAYIESCSSPETSFSGNVCTNLLLIKQILEIRIKREILKEGSQEGGERLYSYASTHTARSYNGNDHIDKAKMEKWKKDLLKNLKKRDNSIRYNGNNDEEYLRFLYNSLKTQDLKNRIKLYNNAKSRAAASLPSYT